MIKLLAGAALAVLAAGVADATVYTQTWTGTVTSGFDSANLFGGGQLTGQGFTATYVFDDSLGISFTDGIQRSLKGGVNVAPGSPNLSTSLTINGLTYSFVGSFYAEAYTDSESSFWLVSSTSRSTTARLDNGVYDFVGGPKGYADPAWSYLGSVASAYSNTGLFTFGAETLNLTNQTYSISAAAVPEPATWAMFIGGFGAIGGAMRRKRTAVRFA